MSRCTATRGRSPCSPPSPSCRFAALTRDLALADRRNLGDLVLRYLPHDGPILEAGCGIGGWVKWLSLHGYDVVGVDWYDGVGLVLDQEYRTRGNRAYDINRPAASERDSM